MIYLAEKSVHVAGYQNSLQTGLSMVSESKVQTNGSLTLTDSDNDSLSTTVLTVGSGSRNSVEYQFNPCVGQCE